MLSNNGSNEYGWAHGGQAGDQTGQEYRIRPWYNGNWTHVFRHPDQRVQRLIARLAIEAALNDLIGYDQGERTTFWFALRSAGFYPADITIACESDCSSSTAAIVKAVGFILGIQALKDVDINMTTYNEEAILRAAGFQVLTDSKYRTSERNLIPGDILMKDGHTCIEVGSGNLNDFPKEDDMPSVEEVWNYNGAMSKIDGINNGMAEVKSELKDALGLLYATSPIVPFGGPVHRLYNQSNGAHAVTNSPDLILDLTGAGWQDEGEKFSLGQSGTPIYELHNPYSSDYLLTANAQEARGCVATGWRSWGIVGTDGVGAPVYRLSNRATGQHLFTTDKNEATSLVENGWTDEGTAFNSAE